MKLLDPYAIAPDIRYINIQKLLPWNDPPDLANRHVEELYSVTSDILDSNFTEKIKYDFAACYSEMYFSGSFRERSKLKVTHSSDEGADFFLPDLNGWAEVVTATDGEEGNKNTIPKPKSGKTNSYPEEQVILRLGSAFYTKASKFKNDILKGLIATDQPIIICISGGWLAERIPMYPVGGYPQIVKVLLPIGDLVFWINKDTKKITLHQYKYRAGINKKSKTGEILIETDFFLNQEYGHISAVVYSWANAGNPIERKKWGGDFYTIHNPQAINKLPVGFIKCGIEYEVKTDEKSFTILPEINHENNDRKA